MNTVLERDGGFHGGGGGARGLDSHGSYLLCNTRRGMPHNTKIKFEEYITTLYPPYGGLHRLKKDNRCDLNLRSKYVFIYCGLNQFQQKEAKNKKHFNDEAERRVTLNSISASPAPPQQKKQISD